MNEDVKARILAAAKKLFAEKGYSATSIRLICEEAGANVALVSYHFGGKEKLLDAVLENFFPDETQYAVMEQMESPVERLTFLIEQFLVTMRAEPEVTRILMLEIMVGAERLKAVLSHTLTFWKRMREAILDGMEQGLFEIDSLDHALVQTMAVLIYPLHSSGFQPMVESWPPNLETEIAQRIRFVLRGLGARTEDAQ